MKKSIFLIFFSSICIFSFAQDFQNVDIDSEVVDVQPMTGIVFWPGNGNISTDAISLEYSYMDFSEIVTAEDTYDWTIVDELLDEMSARNHQAVLRFRYSYPGRSTTVPQYIKDLPDYNETEGVSEGNETDFPDWSHPELKDFTLKFYTAYAERYDNDPRLAFVQVGFGLWAEYHIYSGPFELGVTFPDKEFQKEFFDHLDSVFEKTYWSISIDAADDTYSPFEEDPEYKDLVFGVFDDSFMHSSHSGWNTTNWNFFDRERYRIAPAGGEFSYYSNFDQANVLNEDVGAYGVPYEIFAQNFHISYINGNDQPGYQTLERIKNASLASGYKFKLLSVQTKPDSTIIEVSNVGVAPIYIDAFLAVNGVRSAETLKLMAPDETRFFHIAAGGDNPEVTIESDDILETEEIQYFGTINEYTPYIVSTSDPLQPDAASLFKVYPTIVKDGNVNVEYLGNEEYSLSLNDSSGITVLNIKSQGNTAVSVHKYPKGIYFLTLQEEGKKSITKKIVLGVE